MPTKIKILIFILLLLPNTALAFDWGECPFDRVNDYYPGFCGRYRDLDGDKICDLSQIKPEARGTTVNLGNLGQENVGDKYHIILITVLVMLLYGISEYLVYLNKNYADKYLKPFTAKNIRWFWNVILLWSFLAVIITSIINLLQLYNFIGITKVNYSFWHIEVGIVMMVVTIVHVVKRWRHFIS